MEMDEYGKKRCAEGEMNNCQSDCADCCYLLGRRQKSSLLSGAITAGPLSRGQQHVFRGLQRRWPKHAPKQRREREEERGAM